MALGHGVSSLYLVGFPTAPSACLCVSTWLPHGSGVADLPVSLVGRNEGLRDWVWVHAALTAQTVVPARRTGKGMTARASYVCVCVCVCVESPPQRERQTLVSALVGRQQRRGAAAGLRSSRRPGARRSMCNVKEVDRLGLALLRPVSLYVRRLYGRVCALFIAHKHLHETCLVTSWHVMNAEMDRLSYSQIATNCIPKPPRSHT